MIKHKNTAILTFEYYFDEYFAQKRFANKGRYVFYKQSG